MRIHPHDIFSLESKASSSKSPELSKVPSCKPGVRQNIALHALPTARNSIFLILSFPVYSAYFLPVLTLPCGIFRVYQSCLSLTLWDIQGLPALSLPRGTFKIYQSSLYLVGHSGFTSPVFTPWDIQGLAVLSLPCGTFRVYLSPLYPVGLSGFTYPLFTLWDF